MFSKRFTLLAVAAIAVSGLAVNSAHANRARLLVMGSGDGQTFLSANGQSTSGSFYFDDAYNMNYNPAYVNDFKNWVTVEKSATGSAGAGPGLAMGTVVAGFANYAIGVSVNRMDAIGGPHTASYTSPGQMRPLEVYFGADFGAKVGLSVGWASDRNNVGTEQMTDTDVMIKAGAEIEGFEPFVHFKVLGKDEVNTAGAGSDVKNTAMAIGGRYKWGEWVPYAFWTQYQGKVGDNEQGFHRAFGVGIGRNTRVADGIRLNYATGLFRMISLSNSSTTGLAADRNVIPINVSAEADATSWFTVFAGLNYNLFDRVQGLTNTANTTTGRFGGEFKLGKAALDFAVGSSAASGAADAMDTANWGFDSGLFAASSLTYTW